MASSGSFYSNTVTWSDTGYTLYTKWLFSWEIVSQSTNPLQSVISWRVTTRSSLNSDFSTHAPSGYERGVWAGSKVTINGQAYATTTKYTVSDGELVQQGQATIPHETDGTKTFSVTFAYKIGGNSVNCTGTSSFTLDAILLNPMIATRVSGTYKYGYPYIRVGGTYKQAIEVYQRVSGVYKAVSERG